MIQLYANRKDLVYSEPTDEEAEKEVLSELKKSVERDGIVDVLNCKPSGKILRGNTRLMVSEELGIEYLPINLKSILGLYVSPDGEWLRIRKSVVDYFISHLSNIDSGDVLSHPVIPTNENGPIEEFGPIQRGDEYYFYKLSIHASMYYFDGDKMETKVFK